MRVQISAIARDSLGTLTILPQGHPYSGFVVYDPEKRLTRHFGLVKQGLVVSPAP